MDNDKQKLKRLKNIFIYPTIGIIFFSATFIYSGDLDIHLFGNKIDIRIAGIIFLATMIAYSLPSLMKLNNIGDG